MHGGVTKKQRDVRRWERDTGYELGGGSKLVRTPLPPPQDHLWIRPEKEKKENLDELKIRWTINDSDCVQHAERVGGYMYIYIYIYILESRARAPRAL